MAMLAQADLDVQDKKYDQAITALRELSLDTKGDVPVDAVLSQLGRRCTRRRGRPPKRSRRIGASQPSSRRPHTPQTRANSSRH